MSLPCGYPRLAAVVLLLGLQLAGMPDGFAVQKNTDDPGAVISRFHAALLSTMKHAGSLGYRGRYQRLEPIVRGSYDFPKVVRVTAGKYWRGLNPGQREKFLHTFSHLVIATYAHRFDGYSGESFRTVSSQPTGRGRVVIRTLLIKHNGGRVHLDYLLHQREGRWLIINVIADGVSDLALKRLEYTTVLRSQGFDALMSKLEGKIAQYE